MTRVCPKRDMVCPHGMSCPYAIDRYICRNEPRNLEKERKQYERMLGRSSEAAQTYTRGKLYYGDEPLQSAPPGCICPPTSEQTCQNQLCPRKALPGFTLQSGTSLKE